MCSNAQTIWRIEYGVNVLSHPHNDPRPQSTTWPFARPIYFLRVVSFYIKGGQHLQILEQAFQNNLQQSKPSSQVWKYIPHPGWNQLPPLLHKHRICSYHFFNVTTSTSSSQVVRFVWSLNAKSFV